MSRQLRTRASRPNYATLLKFDDGDPNGAGPSDPHVKAAFDEEDSGSDFAPDEPADGAADEDDDAEEEDIEEDLGDDVDTPPRPSRRSSVADFSEREGSLVVVSAPGPRRKSSSVAKKKASLLVPGIASQSTRKMYTLPSLHHRHRAIPLFDRDGPVERLLAQPTPLAPSRTSSSNSWSFAPIVDRLTKSWGFNVGAGPLWELLEDRGWYKESMATGGEESAEERYRRPRVHEGVKVEGFDVLNPQDAAPFLPTSASATPKDNSPPFVPCSFGPYGKQTRVEMKMFEARKMADFIPGSYSHVFNPGAPAWGLAWCPIHPDDRAYYAYKQYLAVAPFPSHEHSPSIGVRAQRPSNACIQIWSLGPTSPQHPDSMNVDDAPRGSGCEMHCEMVLCMDSGPAFDLKWCPLPANDPVQAVDGTQENTSPRKLGIIAGTFEDGSLSLYSVPDPASVATSVVGDHDPPQPIFIRISKPLLRIELGETLCWSLDWANSEVIAVGCTNGFIAIYNVAGALDTNKVDEQNLLPTHYFNVHQSAIRTLAWIRAPVDSARGTRTADDPTVIASGGYDGVECISDIRELAGNAMNRTRDVVNSLCYSVYCGGPITIDHENIIKSYSLSPSMLGRGHTILEPDGPAWSLAASEYHAQLAVGVTDGSCLTTNTLRATRRGGSVPFLVHKIYQLDYSRKDKEWRMLEKFLPSEMFDRPTASRSNKVIPVGTGAWPREVAIHRVVWNEGNGIAAAPFLASCTGSGLCRVDWLLGKWLKDRIPYGGIEGIKGEVANVADDVSD